MVEDLRDDIASDLGYWEDRLEHDLDNFCDDCDPIMDRVPLEHFGTPCCLEQQLCEPGESRCQKVAEYDEICRLLDELHATRKRIENKKVELPKLPQLALPFEVVA